MSIYTVDMNVDMLQFTRAIADETRQAILDHLCCVWLTVGDLVERLEGEVKQPTVSHHLKKLEEAGLVTVRQDGKYRYYTLNQARYNACCAALVQKGNPGCAMQIIPAENITGPD